MDGTWVKSTEKVNEAGFNVARSRTRLVLLLRKL
jgi:hypothetical protein